MDEFTMEQFKERVLDKLRQYVTGKSETQLIGYLDEYYDIVQEGFTHYRGVEYGCDYAAWNISQCI